MNVLVAGGSGFIGTHLVDALLAARHCVTVFGRGTRTLDAVPASIANAGARFRAVKGSLSDSALLAELLSDCDLVCHLASSTVPGTSNQDPAGDVESNLIGSIRLIEAMCAANVERIIYLSSGGTVYGNQEVQPIPETALPCPISSYGIVKLAIEHYLQMYQIVRGLRPLILRLSNPYGVGQHHAGVQGLINTLLRNARLGRVTRIWGDGTQMRDYIYIDDLIALMMAAVASDLQGVYNVGSGTGYSVNEVIAQVTRITDMDLPVEHALSRRFDVQKIVLDISKICGELAWLPTTDLETGLSRTWAQVQA